MKRILLIVFFYFLMNSAWSASYNNTPPKSKNTHPSHNTPTKSKNTHATHSTLAKSKVTRTSFNAPSKSRITRTPYIGGGIGGFIPQIKIPIIIFQPVLGGLLTNIRVIIYPVNRMFI